MSTGPDDNDYEPAMSARWWDITGPEKDAIVKRITTWVDVVYRPCYGQLAARLPECWAQHEHAVLLLDWLSELQRLLWHPCTRTAGLLSAQAEFSTRIAPAAATELANEARNCRHRGLPNGNQEKRSA